MGSQKTAQDIVKPDITAPGLVWIRRKGGFTPYWRPSVAGFLKEKNLNLSSLADDPGKLIERCRSLNSSQELFRMGAKTHLAPFDGTFGAILHAYRTDANSTFHKLRPGSAHPYSHYLSRLELELSDVRIDSVSGMDLQAWHEEWSEGGEKLAAAKMMRAVLDAAIAFGIMKARPGSWELRSLTDLRTVFKTTSRKLPHPRRREFTITADQVVALRQSAHADGRPSCALTYALVFETTLRLWDVIGQWWPLDTALVTDIIATPAGSRKQAMKWFGIRWEDIDENMVLRYMPSKTSEKTGLAITYPLSKAPMVIEELAHWPVEKRKGPIIVYEGTGLPYSSNYFGDKFRIDRKAAGISSLVWARDLRASAISEAREGGVATDDAAKVAGHASTKTTSAVYDRAALAASERFADARVKSRSGTGL